jgi:hypothetical protein
MPAVTYLTEEPWTEKLMYQRALDLNGNAWNPPVVVAEGGYPGYTSSLVEVEGRPAILYLVHGCMEGVGLYYVRAEDANGESWGERIFLGGMGSSYTIPSSPVSIDGRLALVWGGGRELLYYESEDALGSSWRGPQLIDYGYYPRSLSAAVVNGRPAVSYYVENDENGELRYAVYMPE